MGLIPSPQATSIIEDYFTRFELIVSVNTDVVLSIDDFKRPTSDKFITTVGAVLGLPTIAVPMGFVDSGLPSNFYITGLGMDDGALLPLLTGAEDDEEIHRHK